MAVDYASYQKIHWTKRPGQQSKTLDLYHEEFKVRVFEYESLIKDTINSKDINEAFEQLLKCARLRSTNKQCQDFAVHLKRWCDKFQFRANYIPKMPFQEFMTVVNLWFLQNKPELDRIHPVRRLYPQTRAER